MDIDKLAKYCSQIQNSNPDIVVLAGDVFDNNTPKGYVEAACRLFGKIKSTYGVYYVFGNHDAGRYSSDQYFSKKDIIANMTSNHITVLDDAVKLINNKFYIIGRKDASFSRTANRKTLEELLKGVDKNKFILLLDHQPLEFEKASKDGVDLQLSGHTHGGQIWPSRLITEVFHSDELVYGCRSIDNYNAIVTSGIGAWSYPFKLGSKAEIVQIQIHSN
jgi:predicted MPP superfamily phosphohydrolase